jgi:hypothetical protein
MKERHRFNALKDEHAAATSEQSVPSPEREAAQTPPPSPAPELTSSQKNILRSEKDLEKARQQAERFPEDRITQEHYHYKVRQHDNLLVSEAEKEERLQRGLARPARREENEHDIESGVGRDGFGREREE